MASHIKNFQPSEERDPAPGMELVLSPYRKRVAGSFVTLSPPLLPSEPPRNSIEQCHGTKWGCILPVTSAAFSFWSNGWTIDAYHCATVNFLLNSREFISSSVAYWLEWMMQPRRFGFSTTLIGLMGLLGEIRCWYHDVRENLRKMMRILPDMWVL